MKKLIKKILNAIVTVWNDSTIPAYISWMVISIVASFAGAVTSELVTGEIAKLAATCIWLLGMVEFGIQLAYLEKHILRNRVDYESGIIRCKYTLERDMLNKMHEKCDTPAIYVLLEFPDDKSKIAVRTHLFDYKNISNVIADGLSKNGIPVDTIGKIPINVWTSEGKKS